MNDYDGFDHHELEDGSSFFAGALPKHLRLEDGGFEGLWNLHPEKFHDIMIHGRLLPTPRWQQAFGRDYHYTGQTNRALPVPTELEPYLRWAQETVHEGLNGLLLNWYDGELGHYIGPHHDNTKGLVEGAPIVTISLGEERVFRLIHEKRGAKRDFSARDGTVFIMPYATNSAWKHSVPKLVRFKGRRISVTLRAFSPGDAPRSTILR
jgi:alkylated DNA repair dioxygenase AlkB